MIKIELENPHWIHKDALKLTAEYLLKLSEIENNGIQIAQELLNDSAQSEEIEDPKEIFSPKGPIMVEAGVDSNIIMSPPVLNDIGSETNISMNPWKYIDVDINKMPWDARIHARTKTKNKDGSWKYARGVGPKTIEEVELEYAPKPVIEPVAEIIEEPKPPMPPQVPLIDFPKLMEFITKSIIDKKLDRVKVNEIIKDYGIDTLPMVCDKPELIDKIYDRLEEVVNNAQ